MGDTNQCQFVLRHKDALSGPFLEIGSRDYGSTQDLRSFFPGETYVGVDLSAGDSVDKVLDLTQPLRSSMRRSGSNVLAPYFHLA